MAKNLFQNLDLNLLHVFFILYQERNMRLTANRLFVTQPAISKSLQKLRHHFDEELFVKISTGLEPTSFADKLYRSASPIYQNLEIAINSANQFNSEDLTEAIYIAMSPFLLSSMGSKIYRAISIEAPNCNVQMYNWSSNTLAYIQSDKLHLGVNYEVIDLPSDISEKDLAEDKFVTYVRNGHPYKGAKISLKEAASFDFATILTSDWNYRQSVAQQVFNKHGFENRIKFRSELPSAVIDTVLHSDMIAPLSGFLDMDDYPQLRAIEAQIDSKILNQKIKSYSHYKNRQNPLTQWLEQIIKNTFTEAKKSPLI
ncbi:LysR family transcriptional regulator [Shewanella sp. KT0246]|uniref:LysR family transcriptional regulator n=1 Tax=Shewanella sp. KT0246 TaxID=2815912 RepID=UPI001BC6E272|nr:LysR family transcriptional regulator [Shewanella sp. KT0246]GIU51125.1 LysR family transcriptional regulator [Shewanella sp. KT0246]